MRETISTLICIGFAFVVYKANEAIEKAREKGFKDGVLAALRGASSYISNQETFDKFEQEMLTRYFH